MCIRTGFLFSFVQAKRRQTVLVGWSSFKPGIRFGPKSLSGKFGRARPGIHHSGGKSVAGSDKFGRWRSGKRPWARSTRMWPRCSSSMARMTAWRTSSRFERGAFRSLRLARDAVAAPAERLCLVVEALDLATESGRRVPFLLWKGRVVSNRLQLGQDMPVAPAELRGRSCPRRPCP
jgi:hypothetical protein